jgi:hypothetical protein
MIAPSAPSQSKSKIALEPPPPVTRRPVARSGPQSVGVVEASADVFAYLAAITPDGLTQAGFRHAGDVVV